MHNLGMPWGMEVSIWVKEQSQEHLPPALQPDQTVPREDTLEEVARHRETCPNDHLTPASKDRSSVHPSNCSVIRHFPGYFTAELTHFCNLTQTCRYLVLTNYPTSPKSTCGTIINVMYSHLGHLRSSPADNNKSLVASQRGKLCQCSSINVHLTPSTLSKPLTSA